MNDKRSEHAGLWSRILLHQIVDYLPVGVALLNEQFALYNFNKRCKKYIDRYSRFSSDDALGMSYLDLFPDCQDLLAQVLCSVRDDCRQHIDIEVPVPLDLKSPLKQNCWDATVVPILDDNRRVADIVIFVLDVTELVVANKKLQKKETEIEELKTTLRTIANLHEEDRQTWRFNTVANAKDTIIPFVDKLRTSLTHTDQLTYLEAIEAGINSLSSEFARRLGFDKYALTPTEIQVAVLIKEGKSSKEIAESLRVSAAGIDFHRKNIRKKLGLKNTKTNLRSFLLNVQKL